MSDKNITNSSRKDFEDIKLIDENNIEYWSARELMKVLDYSKWDNFEKVIKKAMESCKNSEQSVKNHFADIRKMVTLGSGSKRKIKDYKLSRYACYLVAQNGDPSKETIAAAQTYFAVQTRKQELSQIAEEDKKRLFIREEVKKSNKKLFKTAKKAGVTNFGHFNEMGYKGLYGMSSKKNKEKKDIGNDSILDRSGSVELAANLFRITQTDDKIKKEKIKGQGRSSMTHFSVGDKVRKTIEEIGGTPPEDLPSEDHIKNLKSKDTKKLK